MGRLKKHLLPFLLLLFPFSFAKAGDLDRYPVFQKGMSYVCWEAETYSSPESNYSLEQLANTNTRVISLLVTQYLDTLNSTNIHSVSGKTPLDNSLVNTIIKARSLGMDVMLKPHVDVADESWRGYIGNFYNETQWQEFFNSYKNFISHYAQFAEQNNIKLLSIGTELKGTTHKENGWRDVINQIKIDYNGKLTYAANFDEFERINWWDKLDYIGIDAYFPLTNSTTPNIAELVSAWQPHITKLQQVYNRFQKPILFTEFGYQSRDGTNITPWSCINTSEDIQEQVDCYNSLFLALWDKPWFFGTYPWNWAANINNTGQCDKDYTPRQKPAEIILTSWYVKERDLITKADSYWNLYK